MLKYLLKQRVFRVGLELTCPNCQLPDWIHLDDVKSRSSCGYCDHVYDVTPQLKDRDWRYRRSGIFGRDDHQAGGVPVALTLQQLDTSLHENLLMYSTGMAFRPASAAIEPCKSDLVAVVSGGARESPCRSCSTSLRRREASTRRTSGSSASLPMPCRAILLKRSFYFRRRAHSRRTRLRWREP